jgi:hypothetical protein
MEWDLKEGVDRRFGHKLEWYADQRR